MTASSTDVVVGWFKHNREVRENFLAVVESDSNDAADWFSEYADENLLLNSLYFLIKDLLIDSVDWSAVLLELQES